VSFLRPVDGALNLFVAPADSPAAARPLTHRSGRGLQAYDVSGVPLARWTPDSHRILFPVDRDGDEKWNLHIVEIATGEEKTLTDLPGTAGRAAEVLGSGSGRGRDRPCASGRASPISIAST
jgi:hypothetical protein